MPIIRVEYIDAAIEKTSEARQLEDLRNLRALVSKLSALEDCAPEHILRNRLEAGEDPRKVRIPAFASSMSADAGAEIHRLQLRKCRRAALPSEIVTNLVQLNADDLTSWREILKHTRLPKNALIAQEIVAAKEGLQQSMQSFIAQWHSAP